MADRYLGEVPGAPVGTSWKNRAELAASRVHRPTQAGICGTKVSGAESIVVNGANADEDYGSELIYTGAGGRDPNTGKQIADQSLEQPGNAGLVTDQLEGLPVRVVRGYRGDLAHSPSIGFRYDGLYRVEDHESRIGEDGFLLWMFYLVRMPQEEAAPYVPLVNLPAGNPTPRTTTGVTTRTVRSTGVSKAVKDLYSGACQVCDETLKVPGGTVAEEAHIRALGGTHAGPDVPENILCLCPNHHSLFEAGGLYIDEALVVHDFEGAVLGHLTVHPTHTVGQEHLGAHQRRVRFEPEE